MTENAQVARMLGYLLYRRDRTAREEGVELLVRRGIEHHMLQIPQLKNMQAVIVSVRIRNHGNIVGVSSYQSASRPLMDHDLQVVLGTWPQMMAIGNFNTKSSEWNSTTSTTRGRVLLRYLQNHNDGLDEPPMIERLADRMCWISPY